MITRYRMYFTLYLFSKLVKANIVKVSKSHVLITLKLFEILVFYYHFI